MKTTRMQFLCIWDEGYVDSPKTEIHEHTWFLERRGYDRCHYDSIIALDIGETADLSDLSGHHWIMRIDDRITVPDNRTQALFTAWKEGKYFDNLKHTVNYPDCTLISMSEPTYTVLVGNQEIQTDDLDEAERWLWNNFVASEKGAGQV